MEQHPGRRPAAQPRHRQRIDHQVARHPRLDRPADHLEAEQVDHSGQIQPALGCGNVGDVAWPHTVRSLGCELASWTGEGTKGGEAWRTRVIYETNLRSSYAAGRYAQLTDPEQLKATPYWRYVHNDSVLSPRPQHKAWGDSRLTLRHDHPFWQTHFPPNGWGCRCRVTAVRAPRDGDATEPPEGWADIDAKTGAPDGIDKGWAYAPGASVADELRDLVAQKRQKLPPELGDALAKDADKVLASPFWDASTPAGAWHEQSFTQAPDWLKSRIRDVGDPKALRTTPGEHPHCAWRQWIDMDEREMTAPKDQSTWRHEYGHHVDGMLASEGLYVSSGPAFAQAMADDAAALIKAGGHGRASKAQRTRIAELQAAYEQAEAALLDAGDRSAWLESRYQALDLPLASVIDTARRYTEFANSLAGIGLDARYTRIAVALEQRDAQGLLDALTGGLGNWREAKRTYARGCLAELSDLIGSATKNKVCGIEKSGYGHSTTYYNKAPYMQGTECYANLFALHGEGGLFFKRVLELLVPGMNSVFTTR